MATSTATTKKPTKRIESFGAVRHAHHIALSGLNVHNGSAITPPVREWAARVRPGAQVIRATVQPLTGGAVARRVEQLTVHLAGDQEPLHLVRKDAPALEIAGLAAAQAVRPGATAIPKAAGMAAVAGLVTDELASAPD